MSLIGIAEIDTAVLQSVRDRYQPRVSALDYREILHRDDIDLVIICTPHYLHHPMALDAFRAGKHVICEKPISMSVQQADEMIDTAQSCKRQLYVSLNMRFTPRFMNLSRKVEQGAIGEIFLLRAGYLGYEVDRLTDPSHWKGSSAKAGGGVLVDGGYHIVDLVNSLLGQATSVQALGGQFVINTPNKGEDNIALLIEYANGAIANLTVSFTVCNVGCNKEPTLILEMDLFGTQGSLFSGYNSSYLKEHLELVKSDGQESLMSVDADCPDMKEHFLDCLLKGTPPMVTALEARNAQAVVEAAYDSMSTGQKVPVNWRS